MSRAAAATYVAPAPPSASEVRGAFLRARLGSLFAILPLGVWTILHLWNNLAVFDGPAAWQTAVTTYPHPVAHAFTVVIVLLPLFIHSAWGIGRMAQARPNNTRYGYFANIKYVLQRLSAIGLLLFLGAHLWLAMIQPRLFEGHAESFKDLSHEMRFHGPTLAVYVLGVLGVAYHLANGVSGFAMGWGIVSSKQALRKLDAAVWVLFAATLALGWGAIYGLYAAGS